MKIGQGLQFNVYYREGKIEKIPTSKNQVKWKLICWNPSYIFKPSTLEQEANRTIKERDELLKDQRLIQINPTLLANLKIYNGKITQDKVTPLKEKIKNYNEACNIIDNYTQFIFKCWQNGFSEKTYNFTINNGIDSNGNVTLIDFGELTFNRLDVEKAIQTKRWEKSHSFRWDLTKKIKEYYEELMDKQITLKNLDKYWR